MGGERRRRLLLFPFRSPLLSVAAIIINSLFLCLSLLSGYLFKRPRKVLQKRSQVLVRRGGHGVDDRPDGVGLLKFFSEREKGREAFDWCGVREKERRQEMKKRQSSFEFSPLLLL